MPSLPPTPDALPRSARTLLHAGVLCILAHALAPVLAQRPLGASITELATPMQFLPWSIALAAGLNNDRIILATLSVLLTMHGWPDQLLPTALAALLGFVIGAGIRSLITEASHG